jgi:hypothetical protein
MSQVQDGEFDYTGLHAFAFIEHPEGTPDDVARRLNEIGPPKVLFASAFVGDFAVFAHVRAEDLAGLQDMIQNELWDAGVRPRWSVESDVYRSGDQAAAQLFGAKRKTPELIGLSQVKVQRGRIGPVLKALGDVTGFKGASVVSGEFDILLQVNGDSFEDVASSLNEVQRIDGVIRTSSAFADGRRKV